MSGSLVEKRENGLLAAVRRCEEHFRDDFFNARVTDIKEDAKFGWVRHMDVVDNALFNSEFEWHVDHFVVVR